MNEEKFAEKASPGTTPALGPAVEEIDTAPKPAAASRREEPPPNPLLLDPYDWMKCTITVRYSLLPDQTVSVSVHNHKDEPIVKTFPAADVPLPEKITAVMARLQSVWPASPVNVTLALLPKQAEATERSIIAAARVSTDTPIIQEGIESDLPLPGPILAMLDELKALIPERGLKSIEKNAKTKTAAAVKPVTKPGASTAASGNRNIHKDQDQMTLF